MANDSQNSPSDKPLSEQSAAEKESNNLGPTLTPEEQEKADKEQKEAAEKQSADAAAGKKKAVKDYDPYSDPIVPSSSLADDIRLELQSGDESPTLKALHDAKKEAEKKSDS